MNFGSRGTVEARIEPRRRQWRDEENVAVGAGVRACHYFAVRADHAARIGE
jgi:hypothetical protein